MNKNNNIHDELKEIAPKLARLEKENLFDIPHNYFQEMQLEVMEKIQEPTAKESLSWLNILQNQLAWILRPKPVLAFAALAFGAFMFFNLEEENNIEQSFVFDGLSAEMVTAYVEDNIDAFESSDLFLFSEFESIDLTQNTPSSSVSYTHLTLPTTPYV